MSKRCFEQAHMTCAEFGLWTQYRMLSHKSDVLFTDGRKTAERFAEENYRHIYRLRESLVGKGWLEETKPKKRGKGGKYTATNYKVLDHAQWVKKNGARECKTSVFEGFEPVTPVSMDGNSPVTKRALTCDTSVNGPVTPVSHSSKKNQFEIQTSSKSPATHSNSLINTKTEAQNSREGINVPPVTPVSMADPIPTMADILKELPKPEQMKLYTHNERYTREDAWQALQEYRALSEVTQ